MDRTTAKTSRPPRAPTVVNTSSSIPNRVKKFTNTTKRSKLPTTQSPQPPALYPPPSSSTTIDNAKGRSDILDISLSRGLSQTNPNSMSVDQSKSSQRAATWDAIDKDFHSTPRPVATLGSTSHSQITGLTASHTPFNSRMSVDHWQAKTSFQAQSNERTTIRPTSLTKVATSDDTINSQTQGLTASQSPSSNIQGAFAFPSDQMAQRVVQLLWPTLSLIKDQQTIVIQDLARSDQKLRDLAGELRRLGKKEKEWEEEKEERGNQEKARQDREKMNLEALVLLAKKMDEVKNDVTGIARVVGVGKGMGYGEGSSMVERLAIVDMNVEEWLEKHRDQEAAMEPQGHNLIQTSLQTMPADVRHEMGISPIRRSHIDQAISTSTTSVPNSGSKDKLVGPSSLKPAFTQDSRSTPLCASCSRKFASTHFNEASSLPYTTMASPEAEETGDVKINSSPDSAILKHKEDSDQDGSTRHSFKTCSHSCHKDKWRNIYIYTRGNNVGKDTHLETHTCGEEACGSIWSTRDDEFVKFGNRIASRCESQEIHERLVTLYQHAWRKLHPRGGEPPMDSSGNPFDFLRDPRFVCERQLPWLANVVQGDGGPAFVKLGVVDLGISPTPQPKSSAHNYDDDPFLSQPMSSSKVTGSYGSRSSFPTMHEHTPVSSKGNRAGCEPSRPSQECSIRNLDGLTTDKHSPPSMSVTGLFSPVDWSKFTVSTRGAREISAAAIPPAATVSPKKSYTLPNPPEGTVAALRKEALGDSYKLDSVVLSSGFSAPLGVVIPVVASGEAAERMLSPESQFGDDNDDRDDYVTEEMDRAPPSPSLSADLAPALEAPSQISRPASAESSLTPVSSDVSLSKGTSLMKTVTHSSMGSELTSLSSIEEVAVTPVQFPEIIHDIRKASPFPPGTSQNSGFTEEENIVMDLVMDDTFSNSPPNSQMTIAHEATSLELLSPAPTKKKALTRKSSRSDMAVQQRMERLREWIRVKRMETLDKQESHTSTTDSPPILGSDLEHIGENHQGQMQNENIVPSSPLFSSPSQSHQGDPALYIDVEFAFPPSPTMKAADQKLIPAIGDYQIESMNIIRIPPTLTSPVRSIKTDANDREETSGRLLKGLRCSPSVISISSDSENEEKCRDRVATSAKAIKMGYSIDADSSNGPHTAPAPMSPAPVVAVSRLLTKSLSPLSELSTEGGNTTQKRSLALRHLIASLKDDDDMEIVSAKKGGKLSVLPSISSSLANPSVVLEKSEQALDPTPKTLRAAQRKGLLVLPKKGQSAALTRVKKRKGPATQARAENESQDEDEQPPLKRVKFRKMAADKGANVSAGDVKLSPTRRKVGSPVKTPTKRSRDSQPRAASVAWPKIDKPNFDSFIECDSCERWYHVGCVGIQPDDIRLSAAELYLCPPCEAGIPKDARSPVKNAQGDSENSACARPKCLCPRITQIVKSPEMYVVEAFVGALKKIVGGRRKQLLYLVKWHGYSFGEATWEREEDMGLPNPGFFIEQFEKEAKREKVELSQCDHQAVLLKCAVDAGWNTQGVFVQKER